MEQCKICREEDALLSDILVKGGVIKVCGKCIELMACSYARFWAPIPKVSTVLKGEEC
jgi:hypothetical protein